MNRRAVIALVAVLAVGALFLTSCAPFLTALLERGSGAHGSAVIETPDADFTDYSAQRPKWSSCGGGARCADVYAPLDWAEPGGERITLRLAKQPATGGDPIGTLFVNLGGPGVAGASAVRDYVDGLVGADVRERYDVIGWDPRGTGDSSAVYCLDDPGLDEFVYGTGDPEADGAYLEYGSDAWIEDGIAANEEFGAACAAETGPLLGHVDTLSTVRDLEMLRGIVGDAKLNYLGYSYGTRIGALYADTFPERSGRLVLDGAMDPAADLNELSRQQVEGIEGALRAYVADCLTRDGCPLGAAGGKTGGAPDERAVDRGMARIAALLTEVERTPIRAKDGRMLYDTTLFTALIAPLYSEWRWPELDTLITEVSAGRADVAFRLADDYNDRIGGVYETNLLEAFTAINCLDFPRPERLDFEAMRADAAETSRLAPVTGKYQTFGDVTCAKWPVPAVDVIHPVRGAGADPLLIVGTTGDPATPYRWAESLAGQLESGVLVTYVGDGHTAYGKSVCINGIVDDYLLRGDVPAADAARCE